MAFAVWALILGLSIVLVVPALVYALECVSGSLPIRRRGEIKARRPSLAVLIPAHNEETGIARTLASVNAQLRPGDKVLVVADNCTDRTADIARTFQAEVIERTHLTARGKGFALNFGIDHLAKLPPELIVFIDADCTLLPGSLDELARMTAATGRPVQSCNLMTARTEQRRDFGVAEFAFLVKNFVRPRGLQRFGLPCQLSGTGMALPWALVGKARFAGGNLAEDMKIGVDLASAGYAPVYCEQAGVRSSFPSTVKGAVSQRKRWEHGHLAMVFASCQQLLSRRVLANRNCLAMTLDVIVPPLTLLVFSLVTVLIVSAIAAMLELGTAPLLVSALSLVLILGSTAAAWIAHGQQALPGAAIVTLPRYVLRKASIYPRAFLSRSERRWVRTERDAP